MATLGYPLFEPVANPAGPAGEVERFHCRRAGTDARGEYTSEGFVVLKGSKGRAQIAQALEQQSFARRRAELIAQSRRSCRASHRLHRGHAVRLAQRRLGDGVRRVVERLDGLEDGGGQDAEYDWRLISSNLTDIID